MKNWKSRTPNSELRRKQLPQDEAEMNLLQRWSDPLAPLGLLAIFLICALLTAVIVALANSRDLFDRQYDEYGKLPLADKRILINVRDDLPQKPFLEAIHHRTSAQQREGELVVSQTGGAIHTLDLRTEVWKTERPDFPSIQDDQIIALRSGNGTYNFSSPFDRRWLWGLTRDGGLVARKEQGRWQTMVSDSRFISPEGTPVEGSQVRMAKVSDDKRWILVVARNSILSAPSCLGLYDNRDRCWISHELSGDFREINDLAWWNQQFFLGTDKGLFVLRPNSSPSLSVEAEFGGNIIDLAIAEDRTLWVLEHGEKGATRLGRSRRNKFEIVINEGNYPAGWEWSDLIFAHEDRRNHELYLAGAKGLASYNWERHSWKQWKDASVLTGLQTSDRSRFFLGTHGGVFTSRNLDSSVKTGEDSITQLKLSGDARHVFAFAKDTGRVYRFGINASGTSASLSFASESTDLSPASFRNALALGNENPSILFTGPEGVLLHSMVNRSYQQTSPDNSAPAWLLDTHTSLHLSGKHIYAVEPNLVHAIPAKEVLKLNFQESISLANRLNPGMSYPAPMKARPAPGGLMVLENNDGPLHFIQPEGDQLGITTLIHPPNLQISDENSFVDMAADGTLCYFALPQAIHSYDLKERSWKEGTVLPTEANEIAMLGKELMIATGDRRLIALSDPETTLVGAGDLGFADASLVDCRRERDLIFLAAQDAIGSRVVAYSTASRKVLKDMEWRIPGNGPTIIDIIDGKPLTHTGNQVYLGSSRVDDSVSDPVDRVFTSTSHIYILRTRQDGNSKYLAVHTKNLASKETFFYQPLPNANQLFSADVLPGAGQNLVALTNAGLRFYLPAKRSWYLDSEMSPIGRELQVIGNHLVVGSRKDAATGKQLTIYDTRQFQFSDHTSSVELGTPTVKDVLDYSFDTEQTSIVYLTNQRELRRWKPEQDLQLLAAPGVAPNLRNQENFYTVRQTPEHLTLLFQSGPELYRYDRPIAALRSSRDYWKKIELQIPSGQAEDISVHPPLTEEASWAITAKSQGSFYVNTMFDPLKDTCSFTTKLYSPPGKIAGLSGASLLDAQKTNSGVWRFLFGSRVAYFRPETRQWMGAPLELSGVQDSLEGPRPLGQREVLFQTDGKQFWVGSSAGPNPSEFLRRRRQDGETTAILKDGTVYRFSQSTGPTIQRTDDSSPRSFGASFPIQSRGLTHVIPWPKTQHLLFYGMGGLHAYNGDTFRAGSASAEDESMLPGSASRLFFAQDSLWITFPNAVFQVYAVASANGAFSVKWRRHEEIDHLVLGPEEQLFARFRRSEWRAWKNSAWQPQALELTQEQFKFHPPNGNLEPLPLDWRSNNQTIYPLLPADNSWVHSRPITTDGSRLQFLARDRQGTIWMATENTLYQLAPTALTPRSVELGELANKLNSVWAFQSKDGRGLRLSVEGMGEYYVRTSPANQLVIQSLESDHQLPLSTKVNLWDTWKKEASHASRVERQLSVKFHDIKDAYSIGSNRALYVTNDKVLLLEQSGTRYFKRDLTNIVSPGFQNFLVSSNEDDLFFHYSQSGDSYVHYSISKRETTQIDDAKYLRWNTRNTLPGDIWKSADGNSWTSTTAPETLQVKIPQKLLLPTDEGSHWIVGESTIEFLNLNESKYLTKARGEFPPTSATWNAGECVIGVGRKGKVAASFRSDSSLSIQQSKQPVSQDTDYLWEDSALRSHLRSYSGQEYFDPISGLLIKDDELIFERPGGTAQVLATEDFYCIEAGDKPPVAANEDRKLAEWLAWNRKTRNFEIESFSEVPEILSADQVFQDSRLIFETVDAVLVGDDHILTANSFGFLRYPIANTDLSLANSEIRFQSAKISLEDLKAHHNHFQSRNETWKLNESGNLLKISSPPVFEMGSVQLRQQFNPDGPNQVEVRQDIIKAQSSKAGNLGFIWDERDTIATGEAGKILIATPAGILNADSVLPTMEPPPVQGELSSANANVYWYAEGHWYRWEGGKWSSTASPLANRTLLDDQDWAIRVSNGNCQVEWKGTSLLDQTRRAQAVAFDSDFVLQGGIDQGRLLIGTKGEFALAEDLNQIRQRTTKLAPPLGPGDIDIRFGLDTVGNPDPAIYYTSSLGTVKKWAGERWAASSSRERDKDRLLIFNDRLRFTQSRQTIRKELSLCAGPAGARSLIEFQLVQNRFPWDVVHSVAQHEDYFYLGSAAGLQVYPATTQTFDLVDALSSFHHLADDSKTSAVTQVGLPAPEDLRSTNQPLELLARTSEACALIRPKDKRHERVDSRMSSLDLRVRTQVDNFWRWLNIQSDGSGRAFGQYYLTSHKRFHIDPINVEQGYLPHDRVRDFYASEDTCMNVLANGWVSVYPKGSFSIQDSSSVALHDVGASGETSYLVRLPESPFVEAPTIEDALYLVSSGSFVRRWSSKGWIRVVDSEVIGAIQQHLELGKAYQQGGMRWVRAQDGATPQHRFEIQAESEAWYEVPWVGGSSSGSSCLALDRLQAIQPIGGRSEVWAVTPIGLTLYSTDAGGRLTLNPRQPVVIRDGNCFNTQNQSVDTVFSGEGLFVRNNGRDTYIAQLPPRKDNRYPDINVFRKHPEDPFETHVWVDNLNLWTLKRVGMQGSSPGQLEGEIVFDYNRSSKAKEPLALNDGRFSFDRLGSLNWLEGNQLEVASPSAGWFRIPARGTVSLENYSRPEATLNENAHQFPLDPAAVVRVFSFRPWNDLDEPQMGVETHSNNIYVCSPRFTLEEPGEPAMQYLAEDGFWRYDMLHDRLQIRQIPEHPKVQTPGQTVFRSLLHGRFTDDYLTGLPLNLHTRGPSREVTVLPTEAGLVGWDASQKQVSLEPLGEDSIQSIAQLPLGAFLHANNRILELLNDGTRSRKTFTDLNLERIISIEPTNSGRLIARVEFEDGSRGILSLISSAPNEMPGSYRLNRLELAVPKAFRTEEIQELSVEFDSNSPIQFKLPSNSFTVPNAKSQQMCGFAVTHDCLIFITPTSLWEFGTEVLFEENLK